MCGRFGLDTPARKIKTQFHINELPDIAPHYNIPPGQDILFICNIGEESNKAFLFHWGLIPSWAKDKRIGNHLANARAESIANKPSFQKPFKSKRGVIVMSGFFEWHQGVTKQPFYFKKDHDELLAVAALWDSWQSAEGEVIRSCCLITTEANELVSPVHNRMPVLLTQEEMVVWMDNTHFNKQELLELMKPYSGVDLISYPVTSKMNKASFDVKEAITPLK